MRTMKKVLALSLVLAMALSMVASAASFKDQATINEDLIEDINLMVALNVFSEDGTGAGNFEPNVELTREQVAKLVYVLKNKGVDNKATSWTGMNIFKDVAEGRWSEGYINYCASIGMIAGTGDGYFNPTGKMTAVEVAKLLLVLNGYKADIEGYTGAKWAENIIADAEAAGIFVDYELPVRGVVTREWVAKLLVNAINVTKVKYEDGEATEMYSIDNQPITFATQDLGLVKETGILVATRDVELGKGAINENGDNKYCQVLFDGNNRASNIDYDVDESLLGQVVDVLYKGNTNAFNSDAKIYGITANAKVKVAETTVDAISVSTITDDAKNVNVKINGVTKKVPVNTEVTVFVDYKDATDGNWNKDTVLFDGMKAGANDGRAVKLIDNNGDGIYDVAFIGSVAYGKVGYINASNHTFRVTNVLSVTTEEAYKDLVFVDTVAKNDIVKITKDVTSGVEKTVIELVDKVTGAISKVKNGTTAVIDGTEYKLAAKEIIADDKYAFATDTKAQDYFVDGKYVVYTDAIGATGSEKQTNIAYVIAKKPVEDSWTGVKTNKVEILKNDGKREILAYDEDIDDAIPFNSIVENTVGEYVIKSGKLGIISLTGDGIGTAEATSKNSNKEFDKSANKFFSGNTTYVVNDETYFFVVDLSKGNIADNKYAVLKASEVNGDMDSMTGVKFGYANEGMPYLYFAVLAGKNPGGDASEGIAIASGTVNEERNTNGDKIYSLEVTKLDGTPVTLEAKTDVFTAVKNQMVKYSIGTDGYATVAKWSISGDKYVADAVKTVEGNALVLNSYGYVELASDAKVYYVDAYKSGANDRIMVSAADGIVEAAEISEGVLAKNVLYKLNDSNKISHIIVEVDGEAIVNYAK